jgi:hypothetical protein
LNWILTYNIFHGAPRKAWHFFRGESPRWKRPNQPSIPSVAGVKEDGSLNNTTEAYTGNDVGHREDRTS